MPDFQRSPGKCECGQQEGACSPPPLASRMESFTPIIDPQLNKIAAKRVKEGLPVYPMHTSLVTTIMPRHAQDFKKGALATEHRPSQPGPLLGDPNLRAAIAESRNSLFKEKITADNVIITSGARHGLMGSVMATTDPGSSLILMRPFYNRYPGIIQLAGARTLDVPLQRSTAYQPDLEQIELAWGDQTRALMITSPNNPTSTSISPAALRDLQSLALKKGGFLIIDETFEAFNFGKEKDRQPKLDLENTILVGSFSETYSIPDLRAGYLIASRRVAEKVAELGNYFSLGTPMCVQRLALELVREREKHLRKVVPLIQQRMKYLNAALLENPSIESVFAESGTFVWIVPKESERIDCRATAIKLARNFGILVKPGAEYSSPGCFRVGLGQVDSAENFQSACMILKSFTGWHGARATRIAPSPEAHTALSTYPTDPSSGWQNRPPPPPGP